MEGRLVQLDFSAAFDGISHCGLWYQLRSIGVERQFLSIVSKFLRDGRQLVVWMVTSVSQLMSFENDPGYRFRVIVVYIAYVRALPPC